MTYEKCRDSIYEIVDELYEDAGRIYQDWIKNIAAREVLRSQKKINSSEKTKYQLKLVQKGAFFYAHWERIEFIRNGNKLIRLLKRIETPNDGEYKLSSFSGACEWEVNYITKVEKRLKPIRQQLKNLSKCHQSLLYAAKVEGDNLKPIPIKERKTLSIMSFAEVKQIYKSA